jgi:hypothetical protein
MIEYFRTILTGQFEAALCMLYDCVRKCPDAHWECKIANDSFRQIAYHTLFFVDYYQSQDESTFTLRDLHHRGGDERLSTVSTGLTKSETLSYVTICRGKALEALAAETLESLQRESGFSNMPFTRGEMHLSNLRHIQHHTGQLSASLRRVVEDGERWWVKTGWNAGRMTNDE